jgi:hypothetical protein
VLIDAGQYKAWLGRQEECADIIAAAPLMLGRLPNGRSVYLIGMGTAPELPSPPHRAI